MGYKVLTLRDKDQWNTFLKKLPESHQDVYYTPEYYSLYEKLGDGDARCFVFQKDGEIALYPFLLNSVNKLEYNLDKQYYDIQGAYGYNGVVTSTFDDSFRYDFFKAFEEFVSVSDIIAEFTRFHPLLLNKTFSETFMPVVFDRKTVYLDLNRPIDKIFSSFQRTTRKQIKRGVKLDQIKIEVEYSKYDINEFYSIYYETMERVKSIDYLYFNKQYFEELVKTIPSIVFTVYFDDEVIASIICIKGKQFLHGHLGGAKMNFLNYSPYSVLYFEIIKEAKKNNLFKIHFGGGSTQSEDDPLLKFKTNFSDSLAEFFIGKKIHNSIVYMEVTEQWAEKFPEKAEQYKNFILKYRY